MVGLVTSVDLRWHETRALMAYVALLDDPSCRRQNSADNAPGHEVICEKKSPDGSTYSVTIDQLKKSLTKVSKPTDIILDQLRSDKAITSGMFSRGVLGLTRGALPPPPGNV